MSFFKALVPLLKGDALTLCVYSVFRVLPGTDMLAFIEKRIWTSS